jgi:hypothetical protein
LSILKTNTELTLTHTMSVSTNDVVDDARGMRSPSSPYTKHPTH